jgi:hypothetical protein
MSKKVVKRNVKSCQKVVKLFNLSNCQICKIVKFVKLKIAILKRVEGGGEGGGEGDL